MAPIVTDALEETGSAASRGLGVSALATSLAVHAAGVALLLLLASAPTSAPQPLPIQVVPIAILQGGAIGEPASTAAGDAAADAAGPAPMPIENPVREASAANDEAAPAETVEAAPSAPADVAPAERVEAVPPAPDEFAQPAPLEAEPPAPVEAASAAAADPVAVAVSWTPPKPPRKAPKRAAAPAPATVDLEATLAKLKPAAAPRPLRALPVSLQQGGESATSTGGDGGGQVASLTPARFSGQGLSNPAPRYPMAARRRGQEGRVLLRVLVTPEGLPGSVSLLRTSGHRLLDKAALAAVEDWRFVPGRRGGAAIESMIDVPIAFKLTD